MTSHDIFTCAKFACFHNYYTITSLFNPPKTLSLFLSYLCSSTHILCSLVSQVAAKVLTEKLQGRMRGKKQRQKRKAVIHKIFFKAGTRIHCFCFLPCFLFSFSYSPLPVPHPLLLPAAPSVCLAFQSAALQADQNSTH